MKNELISLNNFLDYLKKENPELENFIFEPADGRIGKKWALARKNDVCISIKSDFLTYKEMNQLLRGYQLKAENRFKK